uniref:Uncharacterized protein n=1 Tax=Rhizophora mucronata TaxID=61149 RepID=A0A2P2QUI9_RHIMU
MNQHSFLISTNLRSSGTIQSQDFRLSPIMINDKQNKIEFWAETEIFLSNSTYKINKINVGRNKKRGLTLWLGEVLV